MSRFLWPLPLRLGWQVCGAAILLALSSCMTPYLGEAPIVPVTHEDAPNNIQGSWNHVSAEKSWNSNLFSGAQINFPVGQIMQDSGYLVRSRFVSLRFYTGLQTTPGRSRHQAYILGGVGAARSNYREFYSNSTPNFVGDSTLTAYKGLSQNAFVEGGVKLYKGFIGFRGWEFEADLWWVLHGGAKMVFFNQTAVTNNRISTPGNLESPVFAYAHQVPSKFAMVYPVGFMWLYAGKHMRYFYDLTYTIGNKMFVPLSFRVGIGYGF